MKNNHSLKVTEQQLHVRWWKKGFLKWLLHPHQVPIYDAVRAAIQSASDSNVVQDKNDPNAGIKYVLNCARRFGKSSTLIVIAMEECLRGPNRHIRYASPTRTELRKAIHPIMQIFIAQDCPKTIQTGVDDNNDPIMTPFIRWSTTNQSYQFYNGSEIHLAGVNNKQEDRLRGSNSHLNIVDEAGMIDNLDYLMKAILIPQTTTTGALNIIASTPSISPDHEYKKYYDEAMVKGRLSEFSVHDNTSLSPQKIASMCSEYGGETDTDWQREFLCKWVVDEARVIVQEFTDDYIRRVEPDEHYPFYHKYVAMDIGFKDQTAILFGYYDFLNATLIIQDEIIMKGSDVTAENVNTLVRRKELALWENNDPYKRISDNSDPVFLNSLTITHGLYFLPTDKTRREAMVSDLRDFIREGRLIVDPRCSQLIGCLKYGIWNNPKSKKREFDRSTIYGHYDALAAMVYLNWNLDVQTNPIPKEYNFNPNNQFWAAHNKIDTQDLDTAEKLRRAFRKH